MTVVPLPASPCVRVRLIFTNADGSEAGSRFFLSYSGAAPTGANCVTLATDIAGAWNTTIGAETHDSWTLTEVDVLDIATDSGLSGIASVSHGGAITGDQLPSQVAVNIEYEIARRYRGGKPRMFSPPPGFTQLLDAAHWTSAYISNMNSAQSAFFAAIAAFSVGAMGTLAHVNLSYYKGFTNVTNSSGRTRAAPTYRSAALLDLVTGYTTKAELGSQRRRRIATSP